MGEIFVASKYGFKYFKIQDPRNALDIKPYQAELEKNRAEDLKFVINSVNEVRKDFETLKCEVLNIQNKDHKNKDELRKIMFNIEDKISCLKDSIREELTALLRDEISLFREIQFMEKRIEDWGKPIDCRIFKPVRQSNYTIKKTNVRNPATEFQKFLSSSGEHYGGWEEQDHLLFLKERLKHKGKEKFFFTLHCLLPDLTYEEIEKHEKWYQKYQSLKNSQKEAILKWRLERETGQKKEKEKEEKKGRNDVKKKVKKSVRHEINIAERIKEWKKQQALKKLEEEERERREKEKLKEEEKRKKEMQEMKKLAVIKYKTEKLNKAQEIFLKDNTLQEGEAKARNKILLKAFRLQDLKFIEKKKVIRLQIESKSNEKLERLKLAKPALEFILQRNPKRIFQPTLIWNQHCLESQKKEKPDLVFDLNSIPKLAIPEWRKELK